MKLEDLQQRISRLKANREFMDRQKLGKLLNASQNWPIEKVRKVLAVLEESEGNPECKTGV